MKEKFDEFLKIAKELNGIGITPLLMGSLGLEQVTGHDWQARDIDIHIPGDPRGWDAPDEVRIYDFKKIPNGWLPSSNFDWWRNWFNW